MYSLNIINILQVLATDRIHPEMPVLVLASLVSTGAQRPTDGQFPKTTLTKFYFQVASGLAIMAVNLSVLLCVISILKSV